MANASGTLVQKNHYYPFGSVFASTTGAEKQPYKYNGKELDRMHGLNLYDYSARYYESAIGRFTSVDPLAEKKPWLTPYHYCSNNPINRIDPNGEFDIKAYTDEELKERGLTRDDLNRFTSIVTNISDLVKNNPDAIEAIINTTGFSLETVLNDLSFGNGPTISINGTVGGGAQGGSDGITIAPNVIKYLASVSSDDKSNLAIQTLGMASTVLHEYGHYGDQITNNGFNSGQFNPNTGENYTTIFSSSPKNNNIERGKQAWSMTVTGHRGTDIEQATFGMNFSVGTKGNFIPSSRYIFHRLPKEAQLNNILKTLKVK
ncbi:RHS repeat-associated core domain-containing protein [Dysgonomonas sp. 521]|uniref:RHS repeat-associated core domain-containing protein n=1 Tax=Dysgonomonas sp. 521 TaxID=2302932 RepID=UPI00351B00B6